MSITNEIARLQTAKAAIKAAIEDKGVTVPSEATLDDYADYVDGIQTASPVTVTDATDTAGGIIRTITAHGAVIPSASGAFSKIILNGITQIDLTQDTVAAANLLTGETAHGADGQPVVGAASGGGGDEPFVHAITTEEMTLKTFLAAHPIPLKYRDERCWMRLYNDNPPPSGGSFNWVCFTVQNLTTVCMDINYINSTHSPNSMTFSNSLYHTNASYFALTNYQITNSGMTNNSWIIPVGTTVKVLHVPFNWSDFTASSTEIGGES